MRAAHLGTGLESALMSMLPEVITTPPATSEPSIDGLMAEIGLELARYEKGAQSEAEACSHIGALVSAGKQLIRSGRAQT